MSRNKIVLLVEDNDDDVDLALRAFAKSSVPSEIVCVRDGEEALEYLFATGRHADRAPERMPAVVLLDLKLPKVDGLDVLQQVRAHDSTRRLPVVVLTSSAEARDIERSYDLGANSFVRKPVAFSAFIDAANQLGLYWLTLNEPASDVA